MPRKYEKLNLSVKKQIIEAIDRERQGSRSAFVSDLLWYALIATPEEMKTLDNYAKTIAPEQ
jgi:hypothetical protein